MLDELRGSHKHIKKMPIEQQKEFTINKRRWGVDAAKAFEVMYREGVYFRGFCEDGLQSGYEIIAYFEIYMTGDKVAQRASIQSFVRVMFKIQKAEVWQDKAVGHLAYCKFKDVR